MEKVDYEDQIRGIVHIKWSRCFGCMVMKQRIRAG